MQTSDRNILIACLVAVGALVLIACCVCLVLGFTGLIAFRTSGGSQVFSTLSALEITPGVQSTLALPAFKKTPAPPQSTPEFFNPGQALTPGAPDSTTVAYQTAATETLRTLENSVVPVNDPIDLASRLKGIENAPRQLETPAKTYQVGDTEKFWVTNSDDNSNNQVDAKLAYIAEHVYFWVEDGLSYNQRDMEKLVNTFDQEIYPRDREFFGSEWTPGVDADPHLFILYARNIGGSVAGYFSSNDEYLPQVHEYSNAHEMFLLSADHVDLGEEFAYGVLAHEFQHMIHWYRDRNEETWMNEGFSDLAMFLNGYSIGGADRAFVADPDLQVDDWPTTDENRTAHYGAAFLYLTYFLDRFGEQSTQSLVALPENGMVSIDKLLSDQNATDPETGQVINADDVFTDWTLASYLQDGDIGDGRYTYHNYASAPHPSDTETVSQCPQDTTNRDVHQYGVDYIKIRCKGDYNLRFVAPTLVNALPVDPHSGKYAFYSNRGDESDMTLTRSFDFTNQSGPLTFNYWTWYDLEKDYDYLYLLASEDGKTWEFLTTPSGTADDPVGNSYGWGYNGVSGGGPKWIEEKVDLSKYAGKKVQLRFEYITDAAVNGEGLLLDDLSIPEANYKTDFETDDGGWDAQGFVRIQNVLPQTYSLSIIYQGKNPHVEKIALPESNAIEIPLSIGGDVSNVVLVVSGTSRFTRQKAFYQFSLLPR
jgi:immune inhibitor A